MAKFHKVKYYKKSGEVVARGYSISIKKEIIESLNLSDKEIIIEVNGKEIILKEKK